MTIPWLWTSNGDNILENCLDASGSTGAPHYNYAVAHGIPGDAAPLMKLLAAQSSASGNYTYIGNLDLRNFLNPTYLYDDNSENAAADASGGSYITDTFSGAFPIGSIASNAMVFESLIGRSVYGFARVNNSAGTASEAFHISIGPLGSSEDRTIIVQDTWCLWHTNPFLVPDFERLSAGSSIKFATATISFVFTPSAEVTMDTDYCMAVPAPLTRIASGQYGFLLEEDGSAMQLSSATLQNAPAEIVGDPFELTPGRYNILIHLIGSSTQTPAIAYTTTYSTFRVTPRWSLL